MDDRSKNKDQLINELEQMRQRVVVLERTETENRRIQGDLKKQNDELQFILDSVPAYIFYKDREGRLIRGNAAVARSADMPKEGWVGKTVFDLLPGLAESYYEDDMEVMTSGKPKRNIVEPFDTPKGLRWLRTTKIPTKDKEGNVAGLVGFSVDITDRMQAEEALRESEEKLRTIFDSSSDGIVVVDLEGKVVEVNQAALRMAGYSREDVIGRNAFELVTEKDRAKALEVMVNAIKEGPSVGRAEYTLVTADGKEFLAEFGLALLRDSLGNATGFVGSMRDVTERRRAEMELQKYRDRLEKMVEERTADLTVANKQLKQEVAKRERAEVASRDAEERLRTTFESMAEGVLVVDLKGNVMEANKTALRMAKCRKKDLIGRSVFDFVASEERSKAMEELAKTLAAGITEADLDFTFIDADGGRIEAEFSAALLRDSEGNPAGIIGIGRDITERKRMEDALRASEEKLRIMFDSIGDAITLTDLEGRIIDLNKAAVKTFGLNSKEEAMGQMSFEYIAKKSFDRAMRDMAGLFEKGVIGPVEYTFQTADGREFEAESSNAILKDASGKPIGFVSINRDITERKRMQDALRESEEKLRIVFDAITDGIAVTDLEINVVQANQAVTRMAGYSSKEELIGKSALDWIAPEDLSRAMEHMSEALKGRPIERGEFRIRNAQGVEFLGDVGVSPLRDSSGNLSGFVNVIRDVTERRRAEEALRQSEEKYRSLVDHMQEGYLVVRGEHIKYANERCADFLGIPVDKIIGKSIWEFVVPADLEKAKQTGEVFTRGGATPLQEFSYYREDGRMVPMEANLKTVSYEGQPALAVVLRDITERKQMEREIRESEEKLRTMFQTMRDGVVLIDISGKIIDVNEAIVRIGRHGSKEKLIGRIGFDLVADKDRDRLSTAVTASLAGGGAAGMWEAKFTRGDGTEFDAEMTGAMLRDSTGKPAGLIGVIRDISDRKRMEEALRGSEEKLRFMFASMIDAVVVVDLEGKITEINDAALRITGYSRREEVIGKNAFDFIAEEDRARAVGDLAKSLETAPGFIVQYKFVDKDGKKYDVEAAGSMLFNSDGNVTGFINVVRDVTERRRMQEELRQSEEKLRAIFESIGDAIIVIGIDGNIQDVNAEACRMLGCSNKEEMIGQSAFDFIAERDRDRALAENMKNIAEGRGSTVVYTAVDRNGRELTVESLGSMLRDVVGNPIGFITVIRDITERKRMEEELQRIRMAVESAGDAIGMSDPQGKHFYHNRAFTDLFEYTPEELQSAGGGPAAYADKEVAREVFDTIMGGGSWNGEVVMVAKSGRRFPILLRADAVKGNEGNIIGLIGVHTDITERKQAEEALRESEEKLRFMFESMGDAIVVIDLEGKITEVNERLIAMSGYESREEVLGEMPLNSLLRGFAQGQWKISRTVERQGSATVEYVAVDRHGRGFDVEANGAMLRDAAGKTVGFIIALRDVSDRKRMEQKLRDSEEKLRTIFETSPDFIMSLDRDGKLRFINRTVPEMTVEQTIGTSAYDYLLPEAREEYRKTVERIFATGEPAAIETSGLGPGGRTSYYETRFAPVLHDGKVVSITLISTDITERKVAGEALRESEEKLRFMFESMGDSIVVIDAEGKIVEVNERLIAMSGYESREEVLGRNAFEFVTERDRARAVEDFTQNMERQISATIEYVSVDRYGREFDVEANGAMLRDAAGNTVGFIIAIRDVSERKIMEQKLRDSEEMARGMLESAATGIYLVQNGKFEYVSPMFANISGYANDELIGTPALGYVHPDDREMVREKAVESLKGKSGLPYEFRFVRKDGTIVWILEKVASIQYKGKRATIASFMDITEHRRADQALRESQEKLRSFMDSATDYFTIWDAKLNLVDLNESALHYPLVDFTGKIQRESVIGKSILRLEPTIRETDRYDRYMEVIRTGKPFFAEDIIPHTKLGDIHMAISAFKVGEGLGIITTDVTERRRSEEELRKSKVALEKRTNQLLALQKVTASIQSTLSLSEVLQQVAEGVVDNLGYDQSMVLVVDEKADVYRARAFFSKDRPKYREGVESIMEQALADIQFPRKRGYSMGLDESMDGKVVITPNFSALAVPPLDKQQSNAIQKFLGANTIVSMPLFAMERHVGGILAFTAREDIAEPDIEPLRLLADQAGVAIVNANIYEGAAEMAQRLAVTGTLSRILGSSLDIREVYKAFVEEIHNVIDFERASIALVEGDRLRFLAVSPDVEPGGGTMMPVAGSPTEWVIKNKRTNIEHDFAVERQFSIYSVYAEEGMRSAICVPLISKGEAFGSFDLVSRNPNAYGEREQGILEQVAGSVAAAIENSRLFIRIKEHEAELVKAYEELKKAQEYMVQAERLRALGELAGGVAHDFNNVLAIILGRAQLALEDVEDAKLKKDLQIIEQTALDAATTVRRLQDFARVRVDRGFETVDLNEVVEGALQMVESRRMELKETRGVIIDVNADLGEVPSVQGEAAELREALVNIIFNAIDAMPKGGSITVKSRQDKEGVLLSISDTGEGIPDDVKGKIFDPFFTTRPQKGSGLGLSVTYGIITRHGGRIEVESRVGEGATFYIWLPMAIGVKAAKRPEQKVAVVKSAEVLLVDDDPEVSEVLQRMLQQMGHRVTGVNSGEAAVNAFEAGHYDLVVTDLGMPDMSGREVAAAVKDIKPGTPVLLITGWGVQLDPSELPEIDGIVAKPFSKEVLREQVAKLLPAEGGVSEGKQRKKKGPR